MLNNTLNNEKIIFESKGLPSKMSKFLLIIGVILLVISIIGVIYIMVLPDYTGFRSTDSFIDGKMVTSISMPSGIRSEERNSLLILFGGAFIVGALCLSNVFAGRKIYLRIYEKHIEGAIGLGVFAKNVNIPIQQIGELSSNTKGLLPFLCIRTIYGNNCVFLMNANEVIRAENILRNINNSQVIIKNM